MSEEEARHKAWLDFIARGAFSFGSDKPAYAPRGPGSWKHTALGEVAEDAVKYTPAFLQSDWKMFHDALMAHRFEIVHRILPRYGLCIG